jgi:hypothetical protein
MPVAGVTGIDKGLILLTFYRKGIRNGRIKKHGKKTA